MLRELPVSSSQSDHEFVARCMAYLMCVLGSSVGPCVKECILLAKLLPHLPHFFSFKAESQVAPGHP